MINPWHSLSLAFVVSTVGFGQAPDTPNTTPTAQREQPQRDESDTGDLLDRIEAEYRELVVARVIASPFQPQAIELAVEQKIVDQRFNDFVRNMLQRPADSGSEMSPLRVVEKLLPLCTFEPEERAKLAMQGYKLAIQQDERPSVARGYQSQLAKYPDLTSRLLAEAMEQPDFEPEMIELATIIGSSSEQVLQLMMRTASSNVASKAVPAMKMVPELLDRIQRRHREVLAMKALGQADIGEIDPKLIAYARRLIQRSDRNGDLKLSRNEFASLLLNPEPADTDGNDEITVEEYALWMQSRTRR